MSHSNPSMSAATNSIVGGVGDEQDRLDDAMRNADQLLVTSLRSEERRRSRRRIVLFSLGGLVMASSICAIVVGLILAPSAESPAAGNAEQAAQTAAEGWKLWQERDFSKAADKFEEAVKLDPKSTNAWNGLGWARFNSGDYTPAKTAFGKVVALEPNHPAALNGLGQLALLQRKYDEAEKYLRKAAPSAPAAWYGLAKLYLIKGDYEKAAQWAKKVVDSGESDDLMADVLKAAKSKKVPAELKTLIEPPVEPASATGSAKGVANAWKLMNQGRRDEAKAAFEAILAKNPKDANALNGMGWFLLFGGEMDSAKPYFEKALAADPKAAGSMNGLARVLYAQGDVEGAIKIWQEMVEKFPGPHAGVFGLADAYLEKGEFKKAIPLYEKLAKANPTDKQIQDKLAKARKGDAE
jgi:tetratricopeptide (TPR) repeat protein